MKKNDLVLLISTVAISVILIVSAILIWRNTSVDKVKVTVDGVEVASFPLNEDIEYLIHGANGGENLLIIKDGKAYIKEASCPDMVCVRTGNAQVLKPITCLPNKVVVSLEEG